MTIDLTCLAGKRVLVTHADLFMGPALGEVFREKGAYVVDRLNMALTQVLADHELISLLARTGVAVEPSSAAKLGNFLNSGLQKIDQIITKVNVRTV